MFKKRGEVTTEKGFFAKHRPAIAITTLIGTIVGAGILGIPYVVAQNGFLLGFLIIVLIGLGFLFLNLFVGEVILRTKEQHQLSGYAEKYLGPWGKRFMTFSMVVGIYGALIAYLIGEGEVLRKIFGVGSPFLYSLLFFILCSIIIYRGIKATGKMELILVSLLILVVAVIGFFSCKIIRVENLLTFTPKTLFTLYGVVLFSFIGSASIPEMQEELGREKKKLKNSIIIGSLLPIVLYVLFSLIVVGIIGGENFSLLQPNERIATIALSLYTNPFLGMLANFLAVLTMFTSYLTLGTALLEMYHFDYKLPRAVAAAATFLVPLLISFFNLTTFITVLGITGTISGGIDGIVIVLMYWKAKLLGKRKPEYSLPPLRVLGIILILMFLLGIGYQLFSLF